MASISPPFFRFAPIWYLFFQRTRKKGASSRSPVPQKKGGAKKRKEKKNAAR
jgi:hypothetical protein